MLIMRKICTNVVYTQFCLCFCHYRFAFETCLSFQQLSWVTDTKQWYRCCKRRRRYYLLRGISDAYSHLYLDDEFKLSNSDATNNTATVCWKRHKYYSYGNKCNASNWRRYTITYFKLDISHNSCSWYISNYLVILVSRKDLLCSLHFRQVLFYIGIRHQKPCDWFILNSSNALNFFLARHLYVVISC